jgi:cytochrome c peroxidase
MAKLQLGQDLNAQQRGQIVAFLQSLTGEQPQFPLPELPPSTPQTPTPEPFN